MSVYHEKGITMPKEIEEKSPLVLEEKKATIHDEKKIEEKEKKDIFQKAKKSNKKNKTKQRSKRYREMVKLVDKNKAYSPEEAIDLAKNTSRTKFDGSIEAHIRLGIDVKKGDQQVRGAVSLPHGTGKSLIIAAFVPEGQEDEALSAGADIAGGVEIINEIKKTEKIAFDIAIATPDMMTKLAVIAKILGPKGLMPSPKNETITANIKKIIGELKKGKINFKNDDTAQVHAIIGKASFEKIQLLENFVALLSAVKRAKPAPSKGVYLKSVYINATMGPGIRVGTS